MSDETANLLREIGADGLILEPEAPVEMARGERQGWWQPLALGVLFAGGLAGYGLIILALDLDILRAV